MLESYNMLFSESSPKTWNKHIFAKNTNFLTTAAKYLDFWAILLLNENSVATFWWTFDKNWITFYSNFWSSCCWCWPHLFNLNNTRYQQVNLNCTFSKLQGFFALKGTLMYWFSETWFGINKNISIYYYYQTQQTFKRYKTSSSKKRNS